MGGGGSYFIWQISLVTHSRYPAAHVGGRKYELRYDKDVDMK